VKTSSTIHAKNCLHRGMWNTLTTWQYSVYVNAFSDSFMQCNYYITIVDRRGYQLCCYDVVVAQLVATCLNKRVVPGSIPSALA
jgi:hypothetical protein